MKRVTLFYLITLAVVALGVPGMLRLGQGLPAPQGHVAEVRAAPISHPQATSTPESAWEGFQENLRHPLSQLLLQLLVIIAAARVMGKLFSLVGQPSVVGEMAAGILLGPSLFGWLAPEAFAGVFPESSMATLRLLSQVGVCLFMFAVGMEWDPGQLRGKAHTALFVSHASIVVPYLLGMILAFFLFSSLAATGTTFTPFALFLGISMSITAFPVLARILQERGMTKSHLGITALTCAAVGDVTAWTLLAFVVAIAGAGSLAGAGLAMVLVLLFIAVMMGGVRRVLPAWIGERQLAAEEPSRGTLALVVCVVVGGALCSELIGIHALFGAFLAGAIMPQAHNFRHKLSVRVENFSTVLLLPLFFAFTGLRTQIGLVNDLEGWLLCGLIIAVATLGKLGGSALAARFTGMGWRDSLQLGALMNTRGLMELIALNIGYDLGILSTRIFTMLVIMALATTVLTGPLLTLFAGRRQRGESPEKEALA